MVGIHLSCGEISWVEPLVRVRIRDVAVRVLYRRQGVHWVYRGWVVLEATYPLCYFRIEPVDECSKCRFHFEDLPDLTRLLESYGSGRRNCEAETPAGGETCAKNKRCLAG
jgi:hypothetical protein